LFINIRSAASCCQPLQEISVPRAARNGPLLNLVSATVFTILIAISPTPSYQVAEKSRQSAAVCEINLSVQANRKKLLSLTNGKR